MTTKLIQTKDYLLLVDMKSEIKEGDYAYQINYEKTNSQIIKIESDFQEKIANDKNGSFTKYKIIAYYPLTKEAKELDLPLLPNPFKEIDIEKLAISKAMFPNNTFEKMKKSSQNDYLLEEEFGIDNLSRYREVLGFVEGYKAAQSKQFSLEDVKKAIEMAQTPIETGIGDYYPNISEIIQSLSTQQLPKEFIPDKIWINSKGEKGNKFSDIALFEESINNYDAMLKLKTITNSEGKKELVGNYKY